MTLRMLVGGDFLPPVAKTPYADVMSSSRTSPPPNTRAGPYEDASCNVPIPSSLPYAKVRFLVDNCGFARGALLERNRVRERLEGRSWLPSLRIRGNVDLRIKKTVFSRYASFG